MRRKTEAEAAVEASQRSCTGSLRPDLRNSGTTLMTHLEQIERDLGRELMGLAAAGTLKAGDGGRLIAEARGRAETLALKERRSQLLAMVRRLYVEGCLVGDSEERERKWEESARGVVAALGQVIGERQAA